MTMFLVGLTVVLAVFSWAGVSNATSGVAGICTACVIGILARIYQAGEQHRAILRLLEKTTPVVLMLLSVGCAYEGPTSPTLQPAPIVVDTTPPPVPVVVPPTPVSLEISLGRATPYAGEGLTLYANPISGQVTTPATYEWVFGDGLTDTTSTGVADHVYARRGAYTATVTLRDRDGRVTDTSRVVTITNRPPPPPPPPTPPTPSPEFDAVLTCTEKSAGSASPCNLTVSYANTTLPSKNVTHVDWDWGDGIANSTAVPSHAHAYQYAGTYVIFATVTANTKDGPKTITKSATIELP